ncbi:acyltransferase [Enterobacter cloacae complex sp. 2024EL-00215]|uniref:acyltransferase n=1 Tax=unclassified Enterobacter cloacae complex TaxID=2757714 RepID=UPI003753C269
MYELIFKVRRKIATLLSSILFRFSFKKFGIKSGIFKPDILQGVEYIEVGDRVVIQPGLWALALKIDNHNPILNIGDNVYIGRFLHIVSVRRVIIEKDVLIADKVYISDNLHEYKDIQIPVSKQPVIFKGDVVIKEGAWIGENVSIIGVCIGRNSVVAANSVVTKDIPDYSVCAGVPAKVIKKYCFERNEWISVP